jgi:recombinational DNA repair protein (RecF pathway)
VADPLQLPALLAGLRAHGDADMLAEFFTPQEGAITAQARSLAKPGSHLSGRLKPADELRISLARRRSGAALLTGCETTRQHPLWQEGLDHLALYWFMLDCAVTGSGTPELNTGVFRLLVNLLRSAPASSALPACASVFALKLAALHGLLPDLLHCGRDGHAFAGDEPAFLLVRGEGLIGREAYNRYYAHAGSSTRHGSVPQGMLRISPRRRVRWAGLLQRRLLDYPQSGADLADAAVLLGVCHQALADLAHRQLRTYTFLQRQWKLPAGRELAGAAD